jgi:hypothetical protein
MSTTEPRVARAANKVVDAASDAIKEAANVTTSESEPEPAKTTGKFETYTSPTPVYVGGELVKPGDPFTTDAIPGSDWTKLKPKEAAAVVASTERVPDDAQFDVASVEALQAYALVKHVPIVGIEKDRKALITAIKAANEPAL